MKIQLANFGFLLLRSRSCAGCTTLRPQQSESIIVAFWKLGSFCEPLVVERLIGHISLKARIPCLLSENKMPLVLWGLLPLDSISSERFPNVGIGKFASETQRWCYVQKMNPSFEIKPLIRASQSCQKTTTHNDFSSDLSCRRFVQRPIIRPCRDTNQTHYSGTNSNGDLI